jgi:F-type H+-transporting ATPase subunit delta
MSVYRIAQRYARSLIGLSQEQGTLEQTAVEVRGMLQLFDDSIDLGLLCRSPVVKQDTKARIFRQLFEGKVSELMLQFMLIVIRKRRESALKDVFKEFISQYNEIKGITPMKLITAIPVDEAFRNEVMKATQVKYGLSNVEVDASVDEELIGGFVIEFDNKRYDASIAHKLEQIRKEFQ